MLAQSKRHVPGCFKIAFFGCLLALAGHVDDVGNLEAAGCGQCAPHAGNACCVVESENFRILGVQSAAIGRQTADACESLRARLLKRWLGNASPPAWAPKCDLFLHASDEAYLREVGSGGRNTVASSLIKRKQGQIATRRIDVRANQPDWQNGALAHELMHVIMADRFAGAALPRWLDEGIAILADPAEKQNRHFQDLRQALVAGSQFRLGEIVSLADYPAAHRWGTFYGQSASLVEFLVDRFGVERFIKFVERALDQGCERGLVEVYQCRLVDLERHWLAHVRQRTTGRQGPAQRLTAEGGTVPPVSLALVNP